MTKEIRLKPKETYISLPTSNKGKPELVFIDGDRKVVIKLGRKSFEQLTARLCEAYILQHLDDADCMDMVDMVDIISDLENGETEVSDGHDGTYRISDDQ